MKRRKAIGTILVAGGATAIGFGGYKWFSLTKTPDRNYLLSRKTLLEDLAETIIPATDTPGAKEAGAMEFMMNLLVECTDSKTLNRFVIGLQDLEEYTRSRYHHEFSECSVLEKESILHYFDQHRSANKSLIEKVKDRYTGYDFFEVLKKYAVYGYCISEKGAGSGMRYIAVPGKYLSCIPLKPNQKAWATK
jgi:hypothetical protein